MKRIRNKIILVGFIIMFFCLRLLDGMELIATILLTPSMPQAPQSEEQRKKKQKINGIKAEINSCQEGLKWLDYQYEHLKNSWEKIENQIDQKREERRQYQRYSSYKDYVKGVSTIEELSSLELKKTEHKKLLQPLTERRMQEHMRLHKLHKEVNNILH